MVVLMGHNERLTKKGESVYNLVARLIAEHWKSISINRQNLANLQRAFMGNVDPFVSDRIAENWLLFNRIRYGVLSLQ